MIRKLWRRLLTLNSRDKTALKGVLTNIFSKGMSVIALTYSIYVALPTIGKELFGIWMALVSLIGVLSFLDLGVGNSLTNIVGTVHARSSKYVAQVVSAGIFCIFSISCVLFCVLIASSQFIPIDLIIRNGSNEQLVALNEALPLVLALVSLNTFSFGITRILTGLQKPHVANAVGGIASLISIVLLFIGSQTYLSLERLIIFTAGVQSIVPLLLLPYLKSINSITIKVDARIFRITCRKLVKSGKFFLLLQIGTIIGWGIDPLVILSISGPEAVALYSIAQRLYQFMTIPLDIYNNAFWPAVTNAFAKDDTNYLSSRLKINLTITSIVCLIFIIATSTFGGAAVDVWTRGEVSLPITLIAAYGLWAGLITSGNSIAVVLNGCGKIKRQTYVVLVLIAIGLPLKIVTLQAFGLETMLLAISIVYVISMVSFLTKDVVQIGCKK